MIENSSVTKFRRKRKKKKLKIHPLAVIGIVILAMSIVYIVRHKGDLSGTGADSRITVQDSSQVASSDKENDDNVISDNGDSADYNYDIVYSTIYDALKEYKTTFTIPYVSSNAKDKVLDECQEIIYDHPEMFWLTGGCNMESLTSGNMAVCTVNVDTRCDVNDVPKMAEQLENYVNFVIRNANSSCTSDYEQAKYVHDYLVLNCEYDNEAYSNYLSNPTDGNDLGYTAYGCLVEGQAVCEGYAKAYMLIMNRMGIECGYVSGTGTDNTGTTGPHAWNYINLDGDYYMVDVTWDDPVGAGKDYCSYDYFCLTTDEMLKNHSIDSDCVVPYCNGEKY